MAAIVAAAIPTWGFNLIVAHTKLGHVYKVNQAHAKQFIGFVNDLENHYGSIRHIGCYARWGHVHLSQHHVGNACDIEQSGWGRTSYRAMYRIAGLAHKWGLRDGCSFGDCGHVDAGGYGWANGAPPGMVARAEIPADVDTRISAADIQLASTELKPFVRHTQERGDKQRITHHHRSYHERFVSNHDVDFLFQKGKKLLVAELQEDSVQHKQQERLNKWLFY